jgi:glycosyltransferase involved in cell wall biosynthesis
LGVEEDRVIYYLPIEPLDERYTEQWYRWFPAEFQRQGLAYQVIDGEPLVDEVQVGTFLDVNSTLHYKAEQLKRVARLFHGKQVKDGDVFLVADVEFWGIESIRYLAVLNKVNVRMVGFVHAGSYTVEDFMEPCAPFASHYECAWGAVFDVLCVGSDYHKKALVTKRGVLESKIQVTGNPYDLSEVKALVGPLGTSRARVIHTNRPDPEKRPGLTLDLFERLHLAHPTWELMVTTSRKTWGRGALRERALALQDRGVVVVREAISKAEYLGLLAGSRVMTGNTIEENFGYCVLEAMALDTIPVIPDLGSHPELVDGDSRCLFRCMEMQQALIGRAMAHPFPVAGYAEKYRGSLSNIVDLCKG